MKVAYTGVALPEGKRKYNDPIVIALTEKFEPKKVSPYFFEFMPDNYDQADAIVIARDQVLDLLIMDIEKLENRLSRCEDAVEQSLVKRCLEQLESEQPVCDLEFTGEELALITALAPLSLKPVVIVDETPDDVDELCAQIMDKAGMMFFYTAGKQEVRPWYIEKGADAVTCAGKIHTDLARGFIKAEIISFDDLMTAYNFKDAGTKGLTKLVDKNYPIEEKTVLEIRFNV